MGEAVASRLQQLFIFGHIRANIGLNMRFSEGRQDTMAASTINFGFGFTELSCKTIT